MTVTAKLKDRRTHCGRGGGRGHSVSARFCVEMEASSTVRDIKVALSEQDGQRGITVPPPELFSLEFEGEVLEDQVLNGIHNYDQANSYFRIIVGNAQARGGPSSSRDTAGCDRLTESPEHDTPLLSLALAPSLSQVLFLPRSLSLARVECSAIDPAACLLFIAFLLCDVFFIRLTLHL